MIGAENRGRARFFTIGHSTRALEAFTELLKDHGITIVVDVRTIPRSRHNPQFNRETLSGDLQRAGVQYVHEPAFGGLRHANKDSPNGGWRNDSFRGFADYMQTTEFANGLDRLITLGKTTPTAIMCAEAVPWRCHRSLIADALVVRGFPVEEIISATSCRLHVLTPWAEAVGTTITYPPEAVAQTGERTPSRRRSAASRKTTRSSGTVKTKKSKSRSATVKN